MPFSVVLTGVTGSGKTTISDRFASLPVLVVDADVISRNITQPGTTLWQTIVGYFAQKLDQATHTIARADIRRAIFNDATSKTWLETLLHPHILEGIRTQQQQCQTPYCLVVTPLFINLRHHIHHQRCLVVDTPRTLAIQRLRDRDGIDEDLANKMVGSTHIQQQLLALADDVIPNYQNTADLTLPIQQLHQHYLDLGRSRTPP